MDYTEETSACIAIWFSLYYFSSWKRIWRNTVAKPADMQDHFCWTQQVGSEQKSKIKLWNMQFVAHMMKCCVYRNLYESRMSKYRIHLTSPLGETHASTNTQQPPLNVLSCWYYYTACWYHWSLPMGAPLRDFHNYNSFALRVVKNLIIRINFSANVCVCLDSSSAGVRQLRSKTAGPWWLLMGSTPEISLFFLCVLCPEQMTSDWISDGLYVTKRELICF